jgi:hypothetical protein
MSTEGRALLESSHPHVGEEGLDRRAKGLPTAVGVVVAILFLAPIGIYAWFIQQYGANVIWGDQWADMNVIRHSYAGTLGLETLWAQHAEARMFFPNLLVVALAHTTHFNLIVELCISAVLLVAASGLIVATDKRRVPDTSWVFYLPVVLLMLSLVQYQDTLWGFQVAWYIVLVALAAALFVLDRRPPSWLALAGAIALAMVGSFSLFQGLLIWPAGLVLLIIRRRPGSQVLTWLAAGVTAAAIYFRNFNFNASLHGSQPRTYWLNHPVASIRFFFTAIGDVIGVPIPAKGNDAIILLGVAIFAVAIYVLTVYGLRRGDDNRGALGVSLIVFGILDVLFLTLGRTAYGVAFAGSSWYTLFTLLIPVGCYLAVFRPVPSAVPAGPTAGGRTGSGDARDTSAQRVRTRTRTDLLVLRAAVAVLVTCLIIVGFPNGLNGGRAWHRKMLATENVITNIQVAPASAVYDTYVVGPPSYVDNMVRILRRHGLTFFGTGAPGADQVQEGLVLGYWAGQPSPPVSPWRGLRSGQAVVVHLQGLPHDAHATVLVSECSATALTADPSACRATGIAVSRGDATGDVRVSYVVTAGTVGDGTCDESHPCYLEVWQPGDPAVQSLAEIAFASPERASR